MTGARPSTRAARHQRIVDLVSRTPVRSQGELGRLLEQDGYTVTQATLSRDLDELGAVKVRFAGELVYAVPGEGGDARPKAPAGGESTAERLRRRAEELLVSVEASANVVVVRTPPGGAQLLASAIDHSLLPAVMGTVAGDDTILLVTRDPDGGGEVARSLLGLVAPG